MKARVNERIEKVFRPEFINRLDDLIVFHHLTVENLKEVLTLNSQKCENDCSNVAEARTD